jgi:apolipoprotein N-acyltransferase
MQTLGHLELRSGSAPALSILEKATWLDKLPLTLVCGGLLGLSSAGYGVWWLAWFGLAPLILLIYGSRTRSEAMLTGLLFGLVYHMVALRWLLDLYPLDWLGLPSFAGMLLAGQSWFFESLHQAVLTSIFSIFVFTLPMRAGFMPHWERPFVPMLLSVPLIWIFLQWVVAPAPFFMGVPIDQLAYSQARLPAAIQIASLGGAQAVDFMLVLANCALACAILEFTNVGRKLVSRADLMSDNVGSMFDLLFVCALVWIALGWGHQQVLSDAAMPQYSPVSAITDKPLASLSAVEKARIAEAKRYFSPAIPIAVVQGNLTIDEKKKFSALQISERLLPLMSNVGAALVVLPADTLDQPRLGFEPLRQQLAQMALTQKKDFVSGLREKNSDGIWDGVRIFSADKFNKETDYMKYRLLPLTEYTPISFLGGLIPSVLKEHISGGEEHLKAPSLTLIKSVFGRIGASVAAELVYPDLIVSQVVRGASLLVNVSDLSYFHSSMLGQELLAAGALRAVENGRYLAIASNTGISAIIDPHGIVTSASAPGRPGVLLDRVQFLHKKTPFTRLCLWTPLYH